VLFLLDAFCRKNIELETYSLLFGFLISSWKEFEVMTNGLCFALLRLQVWLIVGDKNLKNCILSMKER
jgi:hypothetical protein